MPVHMLAVIIPIGGKTPPVSETLHFHGLNPNGVSWNQITIADDHGEETRDCDGGASPLPQIKYASDKNSNKARAERSGQTNKFPWSLSGVVVRVAKHNRVY